MFPFFPSVFLFSLRRTLFSIFFPSGLLSFFPPRSAQPFERSCEVRQSRFLYFVLYYIMSVKLYLFYRTANRYLYHCKTRVRFPQKSTLMENNAENIISLVFNLNSRTKCPLWFEKSFFFATFPPDRQGPANMYLRHYFFF